MYIVVEFLFLAGGTGLASPGERHHDYDVCCKLTMPESYHNRLAGQRRNMMVVIVKVCAAFCLTAPEAKTEIMCLCMREMSDAAAATFSVGAAS